MAGSASNGIRTARNLSPTSVAAIEGEVDGGVEDDEDRVDHYEYLGPRLEVPHSPAHHEHVDHFVQGDHDLKCRNYCSSFFNPQLIQCSASALYLNSQGK